MDQSLHQNGGRSGVNIQMMLSKSMHLDLILTNIKNISQMTLMSDGGWRVAEKDNLINANQAGSAGIRQSRASKNLNSNDQG